jgi:transposase
MHAARYYYHWKQQGIAVGVREIAKHAGVSHGLAARWVARWKRGEV